MQRAVEVDVQRLLDRLGSHGAGRALLISEGDAGVVDQDVQGAALLGDVLLGGLNAGGIGHVEADEADVTVVGQFLRRCFASALVTASEPDGESLLGEPAGGLEADALVGARDERGLMRGHENDGGRTRLYDP